MRDLFKYFMYIICFVLGLKSGNLIVITALFLILVFNLIKTKNLNLKFKAELNQKSSFIENYGSCLMETINHDLKIPAIAQLRGLELLNNGYYGVLCNSQKQMVKEIENSCHQVISMIDMITHSYNTNKSNYVVNYEKIDFQSLVINCFNELSDKAGEKNVSFSLHRKKSVSLIEADKKELKKVVLTLLSYAVDYSKIYNEINIKINSHNDNLFFTISGKNFLNNFDKKTFSTIGKNISLAFCQNIIEMHNGRLYSWVGKNSDNYISFVIPKHKYSKLKTNERVS